MRARDLMTTNVATVSSLDFISTAAEMMRLYGVGMLPVLDPEASLHICGVITDRDIAMRCVARRHRDSCLVGDHMTPAPLATVGPEDSVETILETMERRKVRRVPVVEEGDVLVGVISQADLVLRVGAREPFRIEQLLESVSVRVKVG